MRVQEASVDMPVPGVRVLVADDDERVRSLYATLLSATSGVASVIEAEDGAEAVGLSRNGRIDVAVLDLNMPRLDGVEAALALRALDRPPRIALHSSDPDLLRRRAAGLRLPLFDKVDFDQVLDWVERQAAEVRAGGDSGHGAVAQMARTLDLCCFLCGYGVVCRTPPARCPMCGGTVGWIEPPATARRALHERLAG